MSEPSFRVGRFVVEPAFGRIRGEGREIALEPRLSKVLLVLARAQGRIVSKDDLVNDAWDGMAVSDDAITSAIYRLRRILAGEDAPYIETAARRGYRLAAPASFASEDDRPGAPDRLARAFDSLAEPSPRALQEARAVFEDALAHDPLEARASAGLAEALALAAWIGDGGPTHLTLAHTAALNALTRDRSCAPAHRAAALTFAFARRDFNSANVHLDRALALEPETRAVWRAQALVLGAQGRLAPANAALDEAAAANPMSLSFAALKIQFLIMARAFDAAAQEVDRVLAIYPHSAPMKTARGWAMYFLGRREQSATAFRDSLMVTAAPQIATGFDQALERAGLPGAFRFVHDLMAAPGLHRRPRETDLAFLAAAADMPEAATEHLRRAIDLADPITHFAAFLPHLDPLRGRAPFEALVARMS